jgi:hypothetical protein
MRQFTYSNSHVASSLWFAQFGLRIHDGTQLLGRSQLVDHVSLPLIF